MTLVRCEECGREVSDRAVVCPGCGFPKTAAVSPAANRTERTPLLTRTTAILATAVVLTLVAIVARLVPSRHQPSIDDQELVRAYQLNTQVADDQYAGKLVRFSGVVEDHGRTLPTSPEGLKPYATYHVGSWSVQLHFKDAPEPELSIGENITGRCRANKQIATVIRFIMLDDCVLDERGARRED